MSTHIDALRDIASNHGWAVCDEAADEIEDMERAYELLFAENAKLRSQIDELSKSPAQLIANEKLDEILQRAEMAVAVTLPVETVRDLILQARATKATGTPS